MTEYEYDQGLRISAIKYPDELSVCYEYNGLGQLTEILNKDGTKYATKGTYDSLGRLVSITAGNGKETTRTWDSVTGVLSGYNWGLEEYAPRYLAWDNVGNIISISKGTSENAYTNTYQYDILGRLLHEKNGAKSEISSKNIDITRFMYVENDVSGKKQGTYRDDIVKLDYYAGSVIVDLEEVQTITTMKIFGKNDRISPEHFEVWSSEDTINWQKEKIRWENDFSGWNLIFDDNTKARYVKLHSLWDERDQNYNAVDKSTYKANIWNFFEVSFIANGKTNSWSYDSRGNRISESVSFGDNPGSINYYDYYQNSDLIKKAGNWYFNYDKNGNLIAKGSSAILYPFDTFASWDFAQNDGELWVYEYDLQNRMINAFYSGKGKANLKHRASYSYDYRGLLVQKNYHDYDLSNYIQLDNPSSSKEITEYYEYSPDGKLIYNEKIEDSCVHITDFIWTDNTLWSQLSNNNVFYHHSDHLGTSELISDSLGNIVWHADYDAFGSVMNERGEENFTPNYTGKFFDKTTNLYYFNARWYDCELGRFTSQDPARDGLNWWAYCGGNPITFVDPTGKEIVDADYAIFQQNSKGNLNETQDSIYDYGCTLTDYSRMANALGADITVDEANEIAIQTNCFDVPNLLSPKNGAKLVNEILKSKGITDVSISYEFSFHNENSPYDLSGVCDAYAKYNDDEAKYFCSARILTNDSNLSDFFEHSVNIPSDAIFGNSCFGKFNNIKIKDTSRVNRDQIFNCISGRNNGLLRLDFFRIKRSEIDE